MENTATCCCGQTAIVVEGIPKLHVVCHCDDCKKRSGSAFGVSAYFADSQVIRKKGDTTIYEIDTETTKQKRYFCSSCATTLYWKMLKFDQIPGITNMTGISAGCFDAKALPAPTMSASHSEKCAWLELPELRTVS